MEDSDQVCIFAQYHISRDISGVKARSMACSAFVIIGLPLRFRHGKLIEESDCLIAIVERSLSRISSLTSSTFTSQTSCVSPVALPLRESHVSYGVDPSNALRRSSHILYALILYRHSRLKLSPWQPLGFDHTGDGHLVPESTSTNWFSNSYALRSDLESSIATSVPAKVMSSGSTVATIGHAWGKWERSV